VSANLEKRPSHHDPTGHPPVAPRLDRRRTFIPIAIGVLAGCVLVVGALMVVHAESKVNKIALDATPKPVTVIEAGEATFRPSRSYVGTLEPWLEARIGPQLVSAYIDTVLVRPGDVVKKGDILATLDCRNASASSQAVAMQARALEARQQALLHESTRVQGLLEGGFVSPNEAEQKSAQSSEQEAQLLATKAKLLGTSLEVNDCVLRAPFAGEIATRAADPGAFARPGISIVSLVDRSMVRIVADAPEVDFDAITPGSKVDVHILATNKDLVATISRRAPAADPFTRTVHFELDVEDSTRDLPVGTTADLHIEVGSPEPAVQIPLAAAMVRGTKASVYVVEGAVAHKRTFSVKGEREGQLFLDPALKPKTRVVTEGRGQLSDNDRVTASLDRPSRLGSTSTAAQEMRGAQ
jgi:RND family efflux transporter MFP subunit